MGHWETKSSMKGLDKLLARVRSQQGYAQSYMVSVYHRATADRTARENGKIRMIQKHQHKLDPFQTFSMEFKELQRYFHAAIKTAVKGHGYAHIQGAARKIGGQMLRYFITHVELGIGGKTGRPLPPLKRGYAIKKNKIHKKKLPILVDTGQMLASLAFRVERIR